MNETGQADTAERKVSICERAYGLLTADGTDANDIIFDPNIFAVATGIDEHRRYAIDFIEAASENEGIKKKIFAELDSIVTDLQNGVNVNAKIGDVDAALTTVRGAQAGVGIRHAAALAAQDSLKTATVSLENRRAGIEDKDLAKAVLDLQVQQTNYQAALAVTAKVLQPTLMDYLR